MKFQISKKLILLSLCAFLLFPAIARAEYTCCSCQANTEICHTGGICESSRQFIGFACATGDRTCSYVCPSGEFTNIPRTSAGGPVTWEAYTGDANINAQGNVVTCCKCTDNTKICQNINQTCTTICGTHGFESTLDSWYRSPTDESGAEGGGTRTTTPPGTESPYAQPNEPSSIGFTPPEPVAPVISTFIPGFVGFSQVKVEGGSISIPWIAEYVNAIYNYILAIAGGLASFLFIVAGFKYVLARGDAGKVAKAKKMMTNTLVGMFMTFGAYLILYTINPELTSFKSIRLDVIQRNALEFNYNYDSMPDGDDSTDSEAAPSSAPVSTEAIAPSSADCTRLAELVRSGQIPVNGAGEKTGLENGGILRRTSCKWCYEDPAMSPNETGGTSPRTQSPCYGENMDVSINPRICTLLVRVYDAKQSGEITGRLAVSVIIGSHSRCSKKTADVERCGRCITTSIAAGPGGNGWGQSDHWRGNGIDLPPNESLHRYIAEHLVGLGITKLYGPYGWNYSAITCPNNYNDSGHNPLSKPVNFSNVTSGQGVVNSDGARYAFHRPGTPADGRALCGHLNHIHISFGE